MPQTMSANLAQMPSILTRIANVSGAELVFKTSSFELHGLEAEVIAGINLIFELDIVKVGLPRSARRSAAPDLISELPPRDSLHARARERASRLHQRQEERQDKQDHSDDQRQNQV